MLVTWLQKQESERSSAGAMLLVAMTESDEFCRWKPVKLDHRVGSERAGLLSKSYNVKLFLVCSRCVRTLNYWIGITIHDIWWDVISSSGGVCSWLRCASLRQIAGLGVDGMRDDRKGSNSRQLRTCWIPMLIELFGEPTAAIFFSERQ